MGEKSTLSSIPKKIEPGTIPEEYYGTKKYSYIREGDTMVKVTIIPSMLDAGFNLTNWAHYAIRKEKNLPGYELPLELSEHLENLQAGLLHLRMLDKQKKKLQTHFMNFQLVIDIEGKPRVVPRSLRVDVVQSKDYFKDAIMTEETRKRIEEDSKQKIPQFIGQEVHQAGLVTRGSFFTDGSILWNPDAARFTILSPRTIH